MADSKVQLPDDSANTGPKIRTQTRVVGANTVHEHYFYQVNGETATLANVAASASTGTLQAANQDRVALMIVNDSADSDLYIKFGATASATSYTDICQAGDTWAMPVPYAGLVAGIWINPGGGAVSGTARVTEVSP